ncbi:hypothetical protein ACOTCA_11630 [Achromobacter xylosoxidans]
MRPHNGWWRASSAPRRWIDLVQESPRWAVAQPNPASQQPPAVMTGKSVQVPTT